MEEANQVNNNQISEHHIPQKNEARLACVKAVYSNETNDTKKLANFLIKDIISVYNMKLEELDKIRMDEKFFKILVTGVLDENKEIKSLIEESLSETWTINRLSTLLRSVLMVAIYELKYLQKIPTTVVINEYVNIAEMFFDQKEVGFVNGILDQVASKVRV